MHLHQIILRIAVYTLLYTYQIYNTNLHTTYFAVLYIVRDVNIAEWPHRSQPKSIGNGTVTWQGE